MWGHNGHNLLEPPRCREPSKRKKKKKRLEITVGFLGVEGRAVNYQPGYKL